MLCSTTSSSSSSLNYSLKHQSFRPPAVQVTHTRLSATHSKARSRHIAHASCQQHNFVLYTKPECPLCDGLKDKLQALIDRAAFMPCFLTGASLEVRDISTNAAWQDEMHLSVPVLVLLDSAGKEVPLPRPQPRIPADRLQQHLQQALQAAGVSLQGSSGGAADSDTDQPFTVVGR